MKFKSFCGLTILLSFCLTSCDHYKHLLIKGDADVYLILGQSNAAGYTDSKYLENKDPDAYKKYSKQNKKVLISYTADSNYNNYFEPVKLGFGCNKECFGPEVGMSKALERKDKPVYIIKFAYGGTKLNGNWLSSGERGDCYNVSIKSINEKLNYLKQNKVNPIIKGVFWMQGESDSFEEEDYSSYKENTAKLIDYLNNDLSNYINNYMNFVDATIKQRDGVWHFANIINQAKMEISNEREHCYCVLTNNENNSGITLLTKYETDEGNDSAHYDSLSMIKLGELAGNLLAVK